MAFSPPRIRGRSIHAIRFDLNVVQQSMYDVGSMVSMKTDVAQPSVQMSILLPLCHNSAQRGNIMASSDAIGRSHVKFLNDATFSDLVNG